MTTLTIYPPDQQGYGEFDGGRITEQKPIGFPGEGSAVKRVGPLFYWAWMHGDEGYIASHPHQAFEIMTYVLSGKAEHGDSLGTRSVVEAGGAQLIQAGSGVYHDERIIGPNMQGFQIWFEPHIRTALLQPPTYSQYADEQFPRENEPGVTVKTVIGGNSPLRIVADARMWDITLSPGASYPLPVGPERTLAALAIDGRGQWSDALQGSLGVFHARDFMVVRSDASEHVTLLADGLNTTPLRMIVIGVPEQVDYPLFNKR
jgi:redox-sensitive bicupin YhaK (pirin superfamily)